MSKLPSGGWPGDQLSLRGELKTWVALERGGFEDCRAIPVEEDSTFGLGMLSRAQNLATLAAVVRYEWLLEMLREDRLVVHYQPNSLVANSGEVFAYECLLRGLGGRSELVSPNAGSRRPTKRGSSST